MYGKGTHSQNDRSHYHASVLRLDFFTEKLKIPAVAVNRDTWNARENSIRNVCSNAHYMRLNLLTGPIGLERKTLQNHSNVSGDVFGKQRVCSPPQRSTMEPQYSLHGCG